VREAQQHIAEAYHWVVDLVLERFFDRVNHDRLFAAVAERVAEKRIIKLIQRFSGSRCDGGWIGEPR
jgi:RNA-directed DNA polymerase